MRTPHALHLYIARERKVLSEGVALKSVVCQDPPKVRMVGENHTKHIPCLRGEEKRRWRIRRKKEEKEEEEEEVVVNDF